jgi:hypothetical protein
MAFSRFTFHKLNAGEILYHIIILVSKYLKELVGHRIAITKLLSIYAGMGCIVVSCSKQVVGCICNLGRSGGA